MKPFNTPKRGFTLIELLVVIAIIALLAAILFPVFARARENARRTNCQSNLKQMALGVIQYSQDYDEHFPKIVIGTLGSANADAGVPQYGWAGAIQPYLKSTQLYKCPSTPSTPAMTTDPDTVRYTQYVMNSTLNIIQQNGNDDAPPRKLSSLNFPSQTVMLAEGPDGRARNNTNGCRDGIKDKTIPSGNASNNGCSVNATSGLPYNGGPAFMPTESLTRIDAARHLSGSNFAFTDGHVKWFKADESTAVSLSGTTYCKMASGTVYSGLYPIGSVAANDGQTVVFGFGL